MSIEKASFGGFRAISAFLNVPLLRPLWSLADGFGVSEGGIAGRSLLLRVATFRYRQHFPARWPRSSKYPIFTDSSPKPMKVMVFGTRVPVFWTNMQQDRTDIYFDKATSQYWYFLLRLAIQWLSGWTPQSCFCRSSASLAVLVAQSVSWKYSAELIIWPAVNALDDEQRQWGHAGLLGTWALRVSVVHPLDCSLANAWSGDLNHVETFI